MKHVLGLPLKHFFSDLCTHDNAKKWFYKQNKKLKSTKYAEFYLEFDGHNLIINLWAQIKVLI